MARRSKFGHFVVYNQSSDAWKHTDEAYNLDVLDLMIGGPNQSPTHGNGDDFNNPTITAPSGSGQWLYPQDTTQITNMGNRTLYNIVRALDYNGVPLGAVFAWWRPSVDVPLPSGCVPADGASYTGATQHSYVPYGLTSITVPDLRNKMILGAYETDTVAPTTALNRDGTANTLTDAATAGPGIGYVGGSNIPRDLRHTHAGGSYDYSHHHTMQNHSHSMQGHTHGVDHQHDLSNHVHGFAATSGAPSSASANFAAGGAGNAAGRFSTVFVSGNTGGPNINATGSSNAPVSTGPNFADTSVAFGLITGGVIHDSSPSLSGNSAQASIDLSAINIFPRYVGLLYVVKIRRPGPVHNTVFPVGT